MNKSQYSHWLTDDEYQKAIQSTRFELREIMIPLEMYGQKPYVDGAIEEIIQLVEQFGKKIRGRDVPLKIKRRLNPRV